MTLLSREIYFEKNFKIAQGNKSDWEDCTLKAYLRRNTLQWYSNGSMTLMEWIIEQRTKRTFGKS